jgi:hypothetical protein
VDDDPVIESPADDDTFDEIREAASAVVASLKWLLEAAERVVEDPAAFSTAVTNGKSVIEAFAGGFATKSDPSATNTDGGSGPAETVPSPPE